MDHGLIVDFREVAVDKLKLKLLKQHGPDGFHLDVGEWFSYAAMAAASEWNVREFLAARGVVFIKEPDNEKESELYNAFNIIH